MRGTASIKGRRKIALDKSLAALSGLGRSPSRVGGEGHPAQEPSRTNPSDALGVNELM